LSSVPQPGNCTNLLGCGSITAGEVGRTCATHGSAGRDWCECVEVIVLKAGRRLELVWNRLSLEFEAAEGGRAFQCWDAESNSRSKQVCGCDILRAREALTGCWKKAVAGKPRDIGIPPGKHSFLFEATVNEDRGTSVKLGRSEGQSEVGKWGSS